MSFKYIGIAFRVRLERPDDFAGRLENIPDEIKLGFGNGDLVVVLVSIFYQ